MTIELPPQALHIYYTYPEKITDQELLQKYLQELSPQEQQKHARFHFAKHRHLYLVAHALVRRTLSRYGDLAPASWQFSENQYGRPEISAPQQQFFKAPLRFNLSHTEGLIACGVVLERDLGVDVENSTRMNNATEVAEHYFSASEVKSLRELANASQQNRFFRYWTLKEAYIKARGMGLALPLDQFSIRLNDQGAPVGVDFTDKIQDDAHLWFFEALNLQENYFAAIACRKKYAEETLVASHYTNTIP